jgi:hypothetical protein
MLVGGRNGGTGVPLMAAIEKGEASWDLKYDVNNNSSAGVHTSKQ